MRVHHRDEFDAGHRGQNASVMLAQVADTDHCYPKRHC
jgi:hypothetical protein